jgi:hypothetical protein
MSHRTSLQGLVLVLAAAGLAAGCSSSSSPSSSASSALSSASSVVSSAESAASSASSAASAAESAAGVASVSAADCTILKPIASNALSELTPLQSESSSKQTAAINAYVASLQPALAKLTSEGGKQLLSGYIAAVQKLPSQSTADATTSMTEEYGKLVAACP